MGLTAHEAKSPAQGRFKTPGPVELPRVLIAAPASGQGKTTVTFALLRLLQRRGLVPHAFKCGPDYLDPMFHRWVLGAPAGNLDLFLAGGNVACAQLAKAAPTCDVAVIEGVMGLYDGLGAVTDRASSYDLASSTSTPVVMVVDARGASLTLAATIQGLAQFRPDANVRGVILNRCSAGLCARLAPAIEEACGIPVLGSLAADEAYALPSRHLGLVAADEVADLTRRVDLAADALDPTLDMGALLGIARSAGPLACENDNQAALAPACPDDSDQSGGNPVTIAVARDEAFCFYYDENLALLEGLGARLACFSPLRDEGLPAGACGLYLGGGYPELHGRELAGNAAMRLAVRQAVGAGMPCLAECGGYIYLQEALVDEEGARWEMVGALPGVSRRGPGLRHFGYVLATTGKPSLLGPTGTALRAHEFHYWQSDGEAGDIEVKRATGSQSWAGGTLTPDLAASFLHLYFPGCPQVARNFVAAARAFGRRGRVPC